MARRVQRKPRRTISTLGWFGIGCGGTMLLGIIALAIIWGMVTGAPALPPEASAGSSAGSSGGGSGASSGSSSGGAAQAVRSAPPLEQQIQLVQQAARREQPVQVTMTLRESEVNGMLAGESNSQVRDLKIYLGDGSIAGTAKVDYRGSTIPLTVRGRPVVGGGQLHFEADEVFIGRLHAPESVRQQVQQELDRGIQQAIGSRNVRVERVEVRPDVMTVTGWVGGR